MRHVDEGAFHAWLDGELEAYPREEAEWIRAHLETCAECARRLEEERAVRDGADAVLAEAPVDLAGLPTLEEMRARARREAGGGGRDTRSRRMPLAWAASIVLAAGAGWMANSLLPPVEPLRDPGVQYLRPEGETLVPAEPGTGVGGEEGREEDGAGEPGAPGEAASDAAAPGEPVQALPQALPSASESTARRQVAEEVAAAQERGAPAPAAKSLEPVADAASPAGAPAASRGAASVLAEAEALSPEGPAVPGLPLVARALLEGDDPSAGVLVTQLLPEGDTLQVFLLPEPPAEGSLPPLPQGMAEWSGARDGGWFVLRGRVSPEVLRGYGAALAGAGGG